jgi:hypothetical protein
MQFRDDADEIAINWLSELGNAKYTLIYVVETCIITYGEKY